ncbi:MAG: HEPN domain-containing protein [Bacteroidales bacterium]|nr:HEPN domain-containing protein [Bacteroidales bacterium]
MTGSQEDYIQYRLDRSEEIFQDAKLLADNKRWRSCINRLYYSSFHLISALLFQNGITPKSHDGLKTKFLQYYIKTGKIDIEYGKLYSRLIDWRQESDYAVYVDFTEEDVIPLINKVEELNKILINHIKLGK